MEKILILIAIWITLLSFPAFAFYRGLCHGAIRQDQKRSHRFKHAVRHSLLYSILGAILIESTDSKSVIFSDHVSEWWLPFLLKIIQYTLLCIAFLGVPFTIGVLLRPQSQSPST